MGALTDVVVCLLNLLKSVPGDVNLIGLHRWDSLILNGKAIPCGQVFDGLQEIDSFTPLVG